MKDRASAINEQTPLTLFTIRRAKESGLSIQEAFDLCRAREEEMKAIAKRERDVELAAWVRLLGL